MTSLPSVKPLARLGIVTAFTLALASACGGQSFTGGSGEAGSSAGGSTGQAGSSARAGSSSVAGSGHAGTGAGGSNAGTGGSGSAGFASAGSGGAVSEECGAAPDSGMCDAAFPAWYHDPSTGICRPFIWGGCGGNANRYDSLAACQKACPGGSPNYDQCKVASDCMITGTGCCGICDGPMISAHDLIAYNKQYAGLLQCGIALDMAGDAAGAAAPVACAPCPSPPGTGTLQYFVPDCVQGQCEVVDLRTSPVTACTTSNDCTVRHGTGCCEGCDNSNLFSVRNDGSFAKLVCGDGPIACPACAPPAPDAVPVCNDGRCSLAYPAIGAK